RSVDAFGNSIDYQYAAGVDGECRIQSITWGANANASITNFAGIDFTYNATPPTCAGVPVGAQTSYRDLGIKMVTGASELDSIVACFSAPGPGQRTHQRQYTLAYSAETRSCTTTHAPYRSLASIQKSAWGVDSPRVDLPQVTFGYGSATLVYSPRASTPTGWFD